MKQVLLAGALAFLPVQPALAELVPGAAGSASSHPQGALLGSGPTALSYYEELDHVTDFTLAGAATQSGPVTLRVRRVGKLVTMCSLSAITCTGNGSSGSTIDSDTDLPSQFRPSQSVLLPGSRKLVAGATQADFSMITINPSGNISITRDASNPAVNWGTSSSNGHQNSFCTSWTVP